MEQVNFLQLFLYLLPAVVVGFVSFIFFKNFLTNEDRRRSFELQKENQKEALPLRLQAYERLTLFLERISPESLLLRVTPDGDEKKDYVQKLVAIIEQEFEHNIAQQIYITPKCWETIKIAKNATIGIIRKTSTLEKVDSSHKLREVILTDLQQNETPSTTGLAFIKSELGQLW